MKNNINYLLFTFFIIITVSIFNPISPSVLANTTGSSMTVSQLIELLITIGAIAPDKAVAARAAVGLDALGNVLMIARPAPIATSTSYIQVLSPNGGESWNIDTDVVYTITWGSTNLPGASIALVSTAKKNNVCELMTSPVTAKPGNNTFNLKLKTAQCYNLLTGTSSPLVDGTYKVRIYYKDSFGTIISDESNATFKILPKLIPSIKVVYPNGGENLIRGRDYEVKYKLTNVINVDGGFIYLNLLDNTGTSVYNSKKAKRSDGVYSLSIPSSLSNGNYKVKFTATESSDDILIEDISDNFFWISSAL